MDEKGHTVSDADMLKQIWDEIRYVRQRLDDHIEDEDKAVTSMRRDMTTIREEMSGHRVKIALMLSGVGIAVTGLFTWMVSHINRIS